MPKENNKMQVDIDTLKKQNVNDLLSIKELYNRIEELGEKTSQIKYIDNTLVKKLKKEYEKLKKIILDENIQVKLTNDIEATNSQLDNIETKKADKTTIWTMANMGQDIKESMTGGSVAVVGKDAVLEENLNPSLKENLLMLSTSFTLENQMINSMLNDTTNWSTLVSSTLEVANNEVKFIPTGRLGCARQTKISLIANHKYYLKCDIKTSSTQVKMLMVTNMGDEIFSSSDTLGNNSYEKKSGIFIATETSTTNQFKVCDYSSASWSEIRFKKPVLIDLTNLYGEGNEPSLNDFENYLISKLGECYFNSEKIYDNTEIIKKLTPIINTVVGDKNFPPIYYSINKNEINVISKYSKTHDICVTLKKKGANNIFDFYQFKLINNNSLIVSSDITVGSVLNTSTTDWHSPFVVLARNNANGDKPNSYQFTGGNHGYNGDATGSSTGRTSLIEFYIDGRKIENGHGYCNFVEIKWINYVQGSNTKKADGTGREILKEIHKINFNGVDWKSEVELLALEDVWFSTLYGFQANIKNSWDENIRYVGGINRGKFGGNIDSESGNKECNKIICTKNNNVLECELDEMYDIGNKQNYNGNSGCFCSSYGKWYFNLVSSAFSLKYNESAYYRAKYRFYSE